MNNKFIFYVPSRYQKLFDMFISPKPTYVDKSSRFLNNFNVKSEKRVQNTGRTQIKNTINYMCHILCKSTSVYKTCNFQRSAATSLADSGVSITNLKRHGQWKSSDVAEGYIVNSEQICQERERMLLPERLRKVVGPKPTHHPALLPKTKKETVGFGDFRAQQAPDRSFVNFLQYNEEDYDNYDYEYDAANDGALIVTMSSKKDESRSGRR